MLQAYTFLVVKEDPGPGQPEHTKPAGDHRLSGHQHQEGADALGH